MSKAPMIYRDSFKLGVLVDAPVQLLDLAPADLFHMLGAGYMSTITLLPEVVRRHAVPEVSIKYIAKDAVKTANESPTPNLVGLTAEITMQATASLKSPDVQPGSIDALMIPGPDPNKVTDEEICSFIRAHAQSGKTDIITVCTGIFPAAYSGILDGHTVTGPRGLLPELRKKFPKVKKWEETRWSKDILGTTKGNGRQAELWTSAGITNGHDAIAAYIREHFGREIADCVLAMADVDDRTREYDAGTIRETSWWLWLIIRSIFKQPNKK